MKTSHFFDEMETEDPGLGEAWDEAAEARRIAMTIVQMRKARGMTQAQLADATGIAQSAISRLENGSTNPTWETVMKVLSGMGVDIFLGFSEHDNVLTPRPVIEAEHEAAYRKGLSDGMSQAADLQRHNMPAPFHATVKFEVEAGPKDSDVSVPVA